MRRTAGLQLSNTLRRGPMCSKRIEARWPLQTARSGTKLKVPAKRRMVKGKFEEEDEIPVEEPYLDTTRILLLLWLLANVAFFLSTLRAH